MKWRGCFLFFLLSFYFITAACGQLITFSVKNERLEKVFLLIEQQSDHHFIYTTEQIEKAKPVTLSVSNEQLSSVLDKCFSGQPLVYNINEKNITVKEKKVVASERPLKGKILDQNGNPVRGVTINIKGTPLVVASDSNGEFGFENAPLNVMLVLSSVEIEPSERFVGNQESVEIYVSIRVGVLDETIVVAYGKTNRRYSTETVGRIKAEDISRQPVTNPLATLEGKISGLQVMQSSGVPGASMTVRIRGRNSLVNGNDPLYIIDGVPFPSASLNDVFAGPGGVTSSSMDNLNPDLIESIEILKDASATAIYGSRGANGVILITTKKGVPGKPVVRLRSWTGLGVVTRQFDLLNRSDYLQMRREAFAGDGIAPTTSSAPDLLLWDTTSSTNWQDKMIGNSQVTTDLNIAVSGGDAWTQYRVAGGYHHENTVYPGSFGQDKVSGSISVSHRSQGNRFTLDATTSFFTNKTELPKEDLANFSRLAPVSPQVYLPGGKLNWEQSTWINPYSKVLQTFSTYTETFSTSLQMGYRLLQGLSINLSSGYTSMLQREHVIVPQSSINPSTSTPASAGFGNKQIRTLIAEPQINYSVKLSRHSINALAGFSFLQTLQYGLYQTGSGYASDELLGSLSGAASIVTNSESNIRYRYLAAFGRLNYAWADKYLASLTVRTDGSSRYGPQNRFATFGSVGVGWVFTKEKWMKKESWLSFGKLKMTGGLTGNDQIGDYKYLDLYSPYIYSYLGVTTYSPAQLFSPAYGWEKVRKLEAALELGMFHDKALLTVNYYYNTTSNQLVNYSLPSSTGFNGILKNLPATIRNWGWEIETNIVIIEKSKWKANVAANFTIPKNRLISFQDFSSSTYANQYVIGKPLSIQKTYRYTGVDAATGVYTFYDYNSDGKITSAGDQVNVVNTAVKYYGGIQPAISYGPWSLNLHFQFSRQPHGRNFYYLFTRPGTLINQPVTVMDRWQKPGDIADVQRYSVSASLANTAYANLQQSDALWTDASFIRLRNLQVQYKMQYRKVNVSFFIQGQNLLTITRYKGLDPETQTQLPPLRVLTAGLQLQF